MSENSLTLVNNEIENSGIYFSLNAEDEESKKILFRAMQAADKAVGDCINNTINLKDVYISKTDIVDKETGEVSQAHYIVLIDADGTSYGCVSKGIFNSLRHLMAVYGAPTWNEPLKVVIKQRTINDGHKLTYLDLA